MPITDIQRIKNIPRRTYSKEESEQVALEITNQLRTSNGTQQLRPQQAIALLELATTGGLFGALRVGAGKTLISLLAPTVLDSTRCILLMPAALIPKTERDREEYSRHWQVSRKIRFMSYEMLGRTQSAKMLDMWQPDLIIADECHRLKNPHAAVTKRVTRYMQAKPDTRFIAMSGTIVRNSVKDYAHLASWALKAGTPLPLDRDVLDQWAEVLDDESNFLVTPNITPLMFMGTDLRTIRESFKRRLLETPGVVISEGSGGCNASLLVRAVHYDIDEKTQEHFRKLRGDWLTPDDWPLADPMQVWRHARELALGLHYIWDPRPPQEWLDARKAWAAQCRQIIIRSNKYDSEKQVADAVQEGHLDVPEYAQWRSIRDTFTPNVKPIWHSEFGLDACAVWANSVGGIIWSHHSFFGEAVARKLGIRYFGRRGVDKNDQPVEDASPAKDGTIVASIPANGTGRNLQRWSASLVTAAPSGGHTWEQLLGRLHREGQAADTVTFDVLCGCVEHIKSMEDAKKDARMILATTGQEQKLLYCDYDYPSEIPEIKPQWTK